MGRDGGKIESQGVMAFHSNASPIVGEKQEPKNPLLNCFSVDIWKVAKMVVVAVVVVVVINVGDILIFFKSVMLVQP